MNNFQKSLRNGSQNTNSLRPPLAFGQPQSTFATRYLLAVVISAAIVLAGVAMSYVPEVPPAHLLIIATGLLGWSGR
jgi:ABC-type Mn2+/Zn2+ transport system permease subunit